MFFFLIRESARAQSGGVAGRGRGRRRLPIKQGARCGAPRTLGSRPEPNADAQPVSHPGAPTGVFLKDVIKG